MSADGSFSFAAAPSPEELARFDLNDLGSAMRLIRVAGGVIEDDGQVDISRATLLYQLGQGWVGYNGRFWDRRFGEQLAKRLAHRVATLMRAPEVRELIEGRGLTARDVAKWVDGCGSRGGTSAMLAQAESYLSVEIDAFDAHPMTLNVRNGTLWLEADGAGGCSAQLRPHAPDDRLTRFIDVAYAPAATCPLFEKVVADAQPGLDRRAFLQRSLGYASTGHVHEQVFFMSQGKGRDGKSTLFGAVRETLGTYGAVGSVSTFLDLGARAGGDAAPDIVRLAGDVRFVILSEPPQGAKLAEGLLKEWTGGEPITARELREKPFEFLPVGKLFWQVNALPVARGADDGLWRRIVPIPFERQVPPEMIDRQLPAKLRLERAGILNWLIKGVGMWLADGLKPPESVTRALDDYRKISSPFGDWLSERCVTGDAARIEGNPSGRTLVKELYADFKIWAEDQGHDKPMSARSFGDALHQRQVYLAGKNAAGLKYRGPIRLKTPLELAEDQAALERIRTGVAAPGAGGGSGPDAPPAEPYSFEED
jgi:putative DNA primase/helicase